jgi:hypothetical protein
MFLDQTRHRIGIGLVQRFAVLRRVLYVARRERLDVRLLARTRLVGKLLRFLGAIPGLGVVLRVHHGVDVRAEHQRSTPPAHRAFRIELGGLEEGALRSVVVEPVG